MKPLKVTDTAVFIELGSIPYTWYVTTLISLARKPYSVQIALIWTSTDIWAFCQTKYLLWPPYYERHLQYFSKENEAKGRALVLVHCFLGVIFWFNKVPVGPLTYIMLKKKTI